MQIFFINLERRPDRRAFMEAQFARLGLAATRLAAVTPAELSAADIARSCDPRRRFWLTPEELGCSLSHLRAYETLLAGEAPWAAIFEDDAVLSPRLPAFLAAFAAAPPPIDLVRLETDFRQLTIHRRGELVDGIRLARYVGWERGSAGYLVSRRAAELHLASDTMRRRAADVALFHYVSPAWRQLAVRQADPALCSQADRELGAVVYASDLVPARQRRAGYRRLRHFFYRMARRLYRDTVIAAWTGWHRFVLGAERRRVEFAAD